MNAENIKYLTIGIFILIGLALFLGGLLLVGSRKLFHPTVYLETYFDDSIQGIAVGSPVKYLGMQIGHVDQIAFTEEIYHQKLPSPENELTETDSEKDRTELTGRNLYIYVRMAINSPFFTELSHDQLKSMLNKNIAKGLRVKLAPLGLTGTAYLEIYFAHPKSNPPLPIVWIPEYIYLPSTPSTISRFTDSIEYIFDELKEINFRQFLRSVKILSDSTYQVTKKANNLMDKTDRPITEIIENLQIMSKNLRILSTRLKNYPSQLIWGRPPPPLNPRKL